MLENSLEELNESVFKLITGKTVVTGLLVKRHNDNLRTHGELSFPDSLKSWHRLLDIPEDILKANVSLLEFLKMDEQNIISESKNWKLSVSKVKQNKERIFLYLDRPKSIKIGLAEALRNLSILSRLQKQNSVVKIDCLDQNDITSLRARYLAKVIENLCELDRKCVNRTEILITTKTNVKNECGRTVQCGAVLNADTNQKEQVITADEFISQRQTEMQLIAQHKYGVRVSTDEGWRQFVGHLGESAAAFELLQCKPSSAVRINFKNVAAGSSRGASFILYNCARLETIIRTYKEKEDQGVYPPLPDFETCDLSLLTEEEEWRLIFSYILSFSSMLNTCVEVNENVCEFRPHNICNFLNLMVKIISQYYRKTRILLEPREHLLPLIFARIHMLKILNDILKTCLRILNIKSVTQM